MNRKGIYGLIALLILVIGSIIFYHIVPVDSINSQDSNLNQEYIVIGEKIEKVIKEDKAVEKVYVNNNGMVIIETSIDDSNINDALQKANVITQKVIDINKHHEFDPFTLRIKSKSGKSLSDMRVLN
ncbi:hypothetical protein [Thalassobacillus pellis]|uniref:hypothetical protein n=1 Tax=Thalassobacillus pellis TaxID=748008 RepID=UPI00196079D2|nr:hypothetical protein [Thalassobacillus pellis]MBM7553980.1 hypothetical protein [Thalassobacillus pellis]